MKDNWYLLVIIGILLVIIATNMLYISILSNNYELLNKKYTDAQILILDNRNRIKKLENGFTIDIVADTHQKYIK